MTMPNAQCPQCSAALPPGAPRCSYCGYTTPWGAVLAQQNERASVLQADQQKRQRIAKAESGARTGMILALVGLPICCGPLSVVGGVLGWRAGTAAKAEGQPRPVTSVISLVVALVSLTLFTIATLYIIQTEREKAAQLAAVGDRLKGKRDAETLDPKVACDLVEEHLVAHGFSESHTGFKEIHCDGAFSVTGRRASQPDVRFAFDDKHFTATACLEKRSRWFVLKVGEGLSCADLPPPAAFTPPPRKLSDAEAEADEAKIRADLGLAVATAAVKTFGEKLARIRVDATSAPVAESACSKAAMARYVTGDTRRKVPTIDLDLLISSGKDGKAWDMLTDDRVRRILEPGERKADDRAKLLDELRAESGPLLVVYKGVEKTWPVIGPSKKPGVQYSYDGGDFTGALFVYDVDTGARLCGAKLAFTVSDTVDFRKRRSDNGQMSAKEAVESDFKSRFEIAATDAIKIAAPDLRLGYLLVE